MIHDLYIFQSNQKLGHDGKNNDTVKYLKKIYPKPIKINLSGDVLLKKDFFDESFLKFKSFIIFLHYIIVILRNIFFVCLNIIFFRWLTVFIT